VEKSEVLPFLTPLEKSLDTPRKIQYCPSLEKILPTPMAVTTLMSK